MKVRIIIHLDNGTLRWPILDVIECEDNRMLINLRRLLKYHRMSRNMVFGLVNHEGKRARIELEPFAEEIPRG